MVTLPAQSRSLMIYSLLFAIFSRTFAQAPAMTQHPEPVNFSQVRITDSFWRPKIDKVSTVTLDACIYQTEVKTARIRNVEKVARHQGEAHEGIFYDDSDVFKALEAIAYSVKVHPGKVMEAKADSWIDKIAAAQLPDGYLNTYFTLHGLDKRWTDMSMHEDYNGGHLIEAAVAYFDATGKRKRVDQLAILIYALFGRQGKLIWHLEKKATRQAQLEQSIACETKNAAENFSLWCKGDIVTEDWDVHKNWILIKLGKKSIRKSGK